MKCQCQFSEKSNKTFKMSFAEIFTQSAIKALTHDNMNITK